MSVWGGHFNTQNGHVTLKHRIIERIRAEGPMPFEVFQRICLYDPDGFFGGDTLRSQKAGDFLTSPEVSPLFGETLARFVDRELAVLSVPPAEPGGRSLRRSEAESDWLLVEVAAGSGSLLRPLLAALETPVEAWAVEASPAARAALESVVPGRVVASLDEVPSSFSGVVIANELLDNLPMAIAVRTDGGWRERWVGVDGADLVLVDAPARPEVEAWAERFGLPCPEAGVVEVQIGAREWITDVLSRLSAGTLLVIDYGDVTENLAPRRQDGTLRTYRAHHLGPHPLDEPGATDITADVNFTAMAAAAEAAGATVELNRQDEFLASLGLRALLSDLRREELEAAREGDALRQMELKSRKLEVETLMHPRGLGDFRVLVART